MNGRSTRDSSGQSTALSTLEIRTTAAAERRLSICNPGSRTAATTRPTVPRSQIKSDRPRAFCHVIPIMSGLHLRCPQRHQRDLRWAVHSDPPHVGSQPPIGVQRHLLHLVAAERVFPTIRAAYERAEARQDDLSAVRMP